MKNLIVVLFAIFFISIHVVANQNEPENGIQFNHSSWKEIVAQAKKENKLNKKKEYDLNEKEENKLEKQYKKQ